MNKIPFKLEQMFGSKTRARLMTLFLQHPKGVFYVRELSRLIDAQLNSVRRELKNLLDMGMILEKEGESQEGKEHKVTEKKKYYIANTDFVLFDDLKILFQKVQVLLKQSFVHDLQMYGNVLFCAFTGRFVGASEISTDLFIVGDVAPVTIEKLLKQLEQESSFEVNYTVLTFEEYLARKQVSDRFLQTIMHADKVVMLDRLTKNI